MLILAAGDTHADLGHIRWIARRALELGCEHVLQVGDFGFWTHEPYGVTELNHMEKDLAELGVTFHVVRGNHDNVAPLLKDHAKDATPQGFLAVREHILLAPDGLRWEWGGKTFISLGGAYSIDKQWRLDRERRQERHEAIRLNIHRDPALPPLPAPSRSGTQWFPDEQMTAEQFDAALGDRSPVDVIVAHDRPASAPLPPLDPIHDLGVRPNAERLADAIRVLRPELYVHGHLHKRYTEHVRIGGDSWTRVEGLSANPAASNGAHPDNSVLVINTDCLAPA